MSASSIQWAAFYSDCEHEIGQIVNGHLITLTYNLYVTEPIGGPLIQNPIVDETSFPLYEQFKAALENPGFFKDGNITLQIGFVLIADIYRRGIGGFLFAPLPAYKRRSSIWFSESTKRNRYGPLFRATVTWPGGQGASGPRNRWKLYS